MEKQISLLTTIVLSATLAFGQQPAKSATISVTPVVAPGFTILGQRFAEDSSFYSPVINEVGETAFISMWRDSNGPHAGVFSLHRIVAREEDTVDGRFIGNIPVESKIAINNSQQVAWLGWYFRNREDALLSTNPLLGLFVDNRWMRDIPFDLSKDTTYPFIALSDDGQVNVLPQTPRNACSPAPQTPTPQQQSAISRGIGGAISAAARRGGVNIPNPLPTTQGRPPLPAPTPCADPLSMLPRNSKGQFVMAVHSPGGGMLLLGSRNGR